MRSLFLLLLLPFYLLGGEPDALLLTWQRDPTTTMTIEWLTPLNDEKTAISYHALNESESKTATGSEEALPGGFKKLIHRLELTSLQPGTSYEFSLPGSSKSYKFRTMPETDDQPFFFVVGGDMYNGSVEDLNRTSKEAAKTSPHFVVIGGDIAYSGASFSFMTENGERWLIWLKSWSDNMVTPEGFLIPIIPVIGNHEVNGGFGQTPEQAKFFYALFPMPNGRAYRNLDFGSYMTLILLDSGHTASVSGEQTRWLESTLSAREKFPNKFAFYHVPAYPSIRSPNSEHSKIVRTNWAPLFDAYHLNVAFEHHDHAYKRTCKILNGAKNPQGTLYLGDGAWSPRKARNMKSRAWYIQEFSPTKHFILAHVGRGERRFFAISENGVLIDSVKDY